MQSIVAERILDFIQVSVDGLNSAIDIGAIFPLLTAYLRPSSKHFVQFLKPENIGYLIALGDRVRDGSLTDQVGTMTFINEVLNTLGQYLRWRV